LLYSDASNHARRCALSSRTCVRFYLAPFSFERKSVQLDGHNRVINLRMPLYSGYRSANETMRTPKYEPCQHNVLTQSALFGRSTKRGFISYIYALHRYGDGHTTRKNTNNCPAETRYRCIPIVHISLSRQGGLAWDIQYRAITFLSDSSPGLGRQYLFIAAAAHRPGLCSPDNTHPRRRSTDQKNKHDGSVIRRQCKRMQAYGMSDGEVGASTVDVVVIVDEIGHGDLPFGRQIIARLTRRGGIERAVRSVLPRAQRITRGEGAVVACNVGAKPVPRSSACCA